MNIDRRSLLKTTGMALLASNAFGRKAYSQSASSGSLHKILDPVLSNAVHQGDVVGVVTAVTDRDQTMYSGAFGKRGLSKGVAMTLDTVFFIASMTKPVTSVAAMQLVEQGKLVLDVPVSRWLPEAARFQVLDGWDERGEPRLRPPRRAVTLRHLLTHTSGLAYNIWDPDLDRYMKATNFPGLASGQEAAFYPPLVFDPGERWEYGISLDLVGKLVEAVSGKSLGTYMRENILVPLNMSSTGYKLSSDMEGRRAAIHQRGTDGKFTEIEWKGQPEPILEQGGSKLYSTAEDYSKFMRMILNGGKGSGSQVLKAETVALMSQNAMGDLRVSMLKTTTPSVSADAEFLIGTPKSWSLGFMVNEKTAQTGRTAGSLAWAGVYNTLFWIDPSRKLGGVFMTQSLPFVEERTLSSFYKFEAGVYQASI